MSFKTDLDYLVAVTGHTRYRQLTDPADPAYRPAWRRIVQEEAQRFRDETLRPRSAPLPPPAIVALPPAFSWNEPGDDYSYVSETL